ncbi:TAXI family TRAP transporter solute-binding subunit [Methylocystis sp. ATCC 49242]|uniref:TAXI family TRAP transporter solute-binding subunit n=1 Tax=Methylocystis sp. ATCC 49242 TaxID=622637 RepID=UPI0001F86CEC|nr:TAXI family TRAP transporter solute-binding subunit [Methylocystis sp. ATCC 49242]
MTFQLPAAVILIVAFLATPGAFAQSLSERLPSRGKVETIEVACGARDKENCEIVVPELGSRTALRGVQLKPLESGGSAESLNGLCAGVVTMAVVQEDALVARMGKADCAGQIRMIGAPLYPYEGFLVVRADTRGASFADMVKNLKDGNILRIAAGGPNSGGELTLRNILAAAPKWKPLVDIEPDGPSTALERLRNRGIDAFFVMDGPQSPLLNQVRETTDPKTKQRVYKFIDFRPDDKMLVDLRRLGLYGVATIEKRWFSALKTITSPAVIAIREDTYRNHPEIAAAIQQAAEDALPAIAVRTGASPNWRQDFYRP